MAFEVYGEQLKTVNSLKYLERILTEGGDDWPTVAGNLIILEEGNLPHPRCPGFDMLVPWRSLNVRHKSTAMCRSGAERKRRRLVETEVRESTEMAFEVYREQLKTVPSFKYIGLNPDGEGR